MINETLVAAAQYMDEHGKTTGVYESADGHVCMLGALRMVALGRIKITSEDVGTPRYEIFIEAHRRLQEFIESTVSELGVSIPYVNDRRLQTKEETVKFMMEAAEWEPSKSE
jgi:hypothetical protein